MQRAGSKIFMVVGGFGDGDPEIEEAETGAEASKKWMPKYGSNRWMA